MYKVAILGCENSHADIFLNFIYVQKRVTDVEVVGIYSDEEEAARKLHEKFGVYVAASYDEFVGKIDGLVVTARHGDKHYKYAKPYIESGIPMFIDKPITVSEQDARDFRRELEEHHIRMSGGSMCVYSPHVREMKQLAEREECGPIIGGYLRGPIKMESIYGGFFFYSQHMIHVMCEIFGYFPKAVQVFPNGGTYTCIFRYDKYDVTAVYTNENFVYYAGVSGQKEFRGGMYDLNMCPEGEFDAFYRVLTGEPAEWSYDEFFAPVYILNGVHRSIQSGKEEAITYAD